jgi:hypothetical protein
VRGGQTEDRGVKPGKRRSRREIYSDRIERAWEESSLNEVMVDSVWVERQVARE